MAEADEKTQDETAASGRRPTYLCIDLKTFYASVECADRGLDPFTTNLVVADPDRTEKTICLAISPAMKAQGIKNRCRVFEIPPSIGYLMAKPRMQRYMEVSTQIYSIYLRYISPDDIHIYSIDECFIDATPYLALYDMDINDFALMLMGEVRKETGITATAGVGENLFLAKVALDVMAKHASDGIGFLDERSFRKRIWFHRPITDIWGIGPGIARRLAKYGVRELGGVAALSPQTIKREFGVNGDYLLDHAWGLEPCTMEQIHSYEPEGHSMVNGQVLACDYTYEEARLVMREMVDASVLELIEKGLVAERISLSVGYERSADAARSEDFFEGGHGKRRVTGRDANDHSGGSRKLDRRTNSLKAIKAGFEALYEQTTQRGRTIKRINIGFSDLLPEAYATATLFDDTEKEEKERALQDAIVAVRGKFGKNAMLKGTSLHQKATMRERNQQVGGHAAGTGKLRTVIHPGTGLSEAAAQWDDARADAAQAQAAARARRAQAAAEQPSQRTGQPMQPPSSAAPEQKLSPAERAHRAAVLHDIQARQAQDGPRRALPDASRARQFMPFAALKGYHELAHGQERVPEARRTMTEERSRALSELMGALRKRELVRVIHYRDGSYLTTEGALVQIDVAHRTLKVVTTTISFDDIFDLKRIET